VSHTAAVLTIATVTRATSHTSVGFVAYAWAAPSPPPNHTPKTT
jgi:hypothetical protein